jgi:hypothetical protein
MTEGRDRARTKDIRGSNDRRNNIRERTSSFSSEWISWIASNPYRSAFWAHWMIFLEIVN